MNVLQKPFRIVCRPDCTSQSLELEAGRDFRLYPLGVPTHYGEVISPRLIDLIRIGTAVYVADGLCKRLSSQAGFRTPAVEVEVWEPSFWNDSSVAGLLKSIIDFVSGDDDWTVNCVPDRRCPPAYSHPFPFEEPSLVYLYSGGLDSAAGLAARLSDKPDRVILPVTVRHQFFQAQRIRLQHELLTMHCRPEATRYVPFTFAAFVRNTHLSRKFGIATGGSSHRCRAFLIAIAGAVVAALKNADCVEIGEAGVGAINLPLLRCMAGWRTTRNTHPRFLRLMSQLATTVAGTPIKFTLPFFDRTKAEMAARLRQANLTALACATSSCIWHPFRRGNRRQCGVCPACIYRRHVLMVAGISEPSDLYLYDLFGSQESFRAIPDRKLSGFKAFLNQAADLQAIDKAVPPSFVIDHLVQTEVVQTADEIPPCVDLLRRYGNEWSYLLSLAKSRRLPWADWLRSSDEIAVA